MPCYQDACDNSQHALAALFHFGTEGRSVASGTRVDCDYDGMSMRRKFHSRSSGWCSAMKRISSQR